MKFFPQSDDKKVLIPITVLDTPAVTEKDAEKVIDFWTNTFFFGMDYTGG